MLINILEDLKTLVSKFISPILLDNFRIKKNIVPEGQNKFFDKCYPH